jgi:putative ABC transport system permease protein
MRPVIYLAWRELAARRRSWAVLVLLVAFAGGAVLTAAAGALRTDSAYPRFLKASKASDVLIAPSGTGQAGFSGLDAYLSAVALLPDVRAMAPVAGLNVTPLGHGSRAATASNILAPVDGRFGHLLEVPKVLAGKLPAPDRAGEIAIDQRGADTMDLHVGSELTMRAVPDNPTPGTGRAGPLLLRERVVGIIVTRGSVFPVNEQDKGPTIMASPALFHRLGTRYVGYGGAYVQLRPGVSPETFRHRAQSLTREFPAAGSQVFVADLKTQATAVEHAIRPAAMALALFALVLAVTALLIVGQAAARLLVTDAPDNPAPGRRDAWHPRAPARAARRQ